MKYILERQIEKDDGTFAWWYWGTFDTVERAVKTAFDMGRNFSNIEDVRVIVDNDDSIDIGHWELRNGKYFCSYCAVQQDSKLPSCPECGVKMEDIE